MLKLKNQLQTGGFFILGVAGHHYISKILDYKNEMEASKEAEMKAIADQQNMEVIHNKLNNLQQSSQSLAENMTKLLDKNVNISEAQLSSISTKLEFGAKHCKTVKEMFDKGPENMNLEFYKAAYKASEACERANREAHDAVKALLESINGKSNLISNLDFFYDYLNSLSLLETAALYHIIVLTLICLISFNILSAVLGNEIIKYFKLEERYPKLASFFKLRLKFQRYYLILNFSLIFIICIVSILINILVLY